MWVRNNQDWNAETTFIEFVCLKGKSSFDKLSLKKIISLYKKLFRELNDGMLSTQCLLFITYVFHVLEKFETS